MTMTVGDLLSYLDQHPGVTLRVRVEGGIAYLSATQGDCDCTRVIALRGCHVHADDAGHEVRGVIGDAVRHQAHGAHQ